MARHKVTKTSTQGYGSRIAGSFKGILAGLGIFIASFVLLWWNEGRAVTRTKALDEGAAVVIEVSADKVDPDNEGKLIHVSGLITSEDTVKDLDFGIVSNQLKLNRKVEMYQWVEESTSKTDKNLGGSETTTTEYTYTKQWSSSLKNSADFEEPNGHQNPGGFPVEPSRMQVSSGKLGDFDVKYELIEGLGGGTPISLDPASVICPSNGKVTSNHIYIGRGTSSSPQIGDVKVSFEELKEGVYSIIGKQVGNSFDDYQTENNSDLFLIESGSKSADSMIETAHSNNSKMTWALRLAGFLMMMFGIRKVFKPIEVIADVIPLLGTILGAGIGLFAGVMAFLLSFLTIGIAWIRFRPILAFSLIGIGVAAFILVYIRARKKKQAASF
ncbi:MAG: TMEM43 family protein [Crocinitomicaceae bacterium]